MALKYSRSACGKSGGARDAAHGGLVFPVDGQVQVLEQVQPQHPDRAIRMLVGHRAAGRKATKLREIQLPELQRADIPGGKAQVAGTTPRR